MSGERISLGVIGATGFVGGTICRQAEVAGAYNSRNIEDARGRTFDTLVCAGAPGAKWKANRDADGDLENIERLIGNLREVTADRFVLISTVDVFANPVGVDEATMVDTVRLEPYGRNRYHLEESVRGMFPRVSIVRLPGLFGTGLKKNFIYDLLNGNALHLTHRESTFQFYDMTNLWKDIKQVLAADLPLANLAVEPIKAGEIARECFAIEFKNETERPPVHYDMRTGLAAEFGCSGPYLYSAGYTFRAVRRFAMSSWKAGAA
jgi:hypothetical protein